MKLLKRNLSNKIRAPFYRMYNKIVEDLFCRDDLTVCVPCDNWVKRDENWNLYTYMYWNKYSVTIKSF